MVIKNPRNKKGNGSGATDKDLADMNAALAYQRGPVYEAMVKVRENLSPEERPMMSGSGLSGILSPKESQKRVDARIKALQKQQGNAVASAKAAADMAWEREKRQWERQDRTWTLADRARQERLAEEERAREAAGLARKGAAYRGIADLYTTQGEEAYKTALQNIAAGYGGEESALAGTRERQLASLARAMGESRGQITSAEQQALSSLISPTAYQNVPLVNLAPQQQVLQAALAAEGVGASPEQAAEMDYARQLAQQFNELASRSAQQLNVGEQNYLAALRNALTGGALAARTGVEQRGQAVTGGIEEQYAVAARELARQRRAEQAAADAARQEAMLRAAQARAEAEGYSPSPAPKREEQQPAATETPEEVARRKALERLAEGILRGELQQFA
jgi:hypothetical protein